MNSLRSSNVNPENPLITFVVFAYNQEKFIREAVVGAFSQTYSPLEIILSDDCSQDATYEIMQDMVLTYKGPHQVRLNQNSRNLGLTAHVNKVITMSRGDYYVLAAGDDISLPERTRVLAQYWKDSPHVSAIQSNFVCIDENSDTRLVNEESPLPANRLLNWTDPNFHAQVLRNYYKSLRGATLSYRKEVLSVFGPLNEGLMAEDQVLAFRACLLSNVQFIDEVLVKYRQHSTNLFNRMKTVNNLTIFENEMQIAFYRRQKALRMQSHLSDLDTLSVKIGNTSGYVELRKMLERNGLVNRFLGDWWNLGFVSKISGLINTLYPFGTKADWRWAVKRSLPFSLFCFLVERKGISKFRLPQQ